MITDEEVDAIYATAHAATAGLEGQLTTAIERLQAVRGEGPRLVLGALVRHLQLALADVQSMERAAASPVAAAAQLTDP